MSAPRAETPTSPSPSPPGPHAGGADSTIVPPQSSAAVDRTAERAAADEQTARVSVEEIVQRDLESRTRAVTDALYELALSVSDVAPGAETHVPDKMWVKTSARACLRQQCYSATTRRSRGDEGPHSYVRPQRRRRVSVGCPVSSDASLVDAGRNPDSHTRTFVNRLASENQYSLGQHESIRVRFARDGSLTAEISR